MMLHKFHIQLLWNIKCTRYAKLGEQCGCGCECGC